MGMFDSVYIEEHKCPKCGQIVDGELQTKSLDCTLQHWHFPDFIPDVEPEEVKKIYLYDSCLCGWRDDWIGWIENQVLHELKPPGGMDMVTLKVEPTDELRNSLAEIQMLKQLGQAKKSLALSFAVFIWKFHPDKRGILFDILKEELGLFREHFEKYTVSSCLNPLHHAFGIIGGPQTNYWKLEDKTQEQQDKEKKFCSEAMNLPVGEERTAIVEAIDIEQLLDK